MALTPAARYLGLDGESADRAIIGIAKIGQCLRDRVPNFTHFDPEGLHIRRAQIGSSALQHLTEAKRILSRFGQTPILARVEIALAELEQ